MADSVHQADDGRTGFASPLSEPSAIDQGELPARLSHTRGPWTVKRDGLYVLIEKDKFSAIECYAGTYANALLIAAAPDLLAALQRISNEAGEVYAGNFTWRVSEEAMYQVRAAIQKATPALASKETQ